MSCDLAGAHAGQHLVHQEHALLDPAGLAQRQRQVAQGLELEVDVAVAASERQRLPADRLVAGGVAVLVDRHDERPAVLGGVVAGLVEERAGPADPPVGHGPVAVEVGVQPGQAAGGPGGTQPVTAGPVRPEHLLVAGDGPPVVERR